MNKNKKLLDNFVAYCQQHPEERFWQALRNWVGKDFILVTKKGVDRTELNDTIEDTFYWEGRDG